jgi:hypothetical protein
MPAKGSGDTYDLIPKWARTLAVRNFSWDIYRTPLPQKNNSNIKVDI